MTLFPSLPKSLQTEMDSIEGEALKGAFRKGVIAFREMGNKSVNPYKAKYKKNGRATFAMAFRNSWNKGYLAAKKEFGK